MPDPACAKNAPYPALVQASVGDADRRYGICRGFAVRKLETTRLQTCPAVTACAATSVTLTCVTVIGNGSADERSEPSSQQVVEPMLHTLTIASVKAGIDTLQTLRIHEQFPAYLQVRQQAVEAGNFDEIVPQWAEVAELLKMPGGPPKKPNYRPWSSRKVKDPSRLWYNENLAGSFAPKSIRTTSRFMLNDAGDGFALPHDHAKRALAILLKGSKVPAWALAAYYLRNYGFIFTGVGGHDELIDGFKKEFLFAGSTDFEVLFDDSDPQMPFDWFELYEPKEVATDATSVEGVLDA